MKHNPACRPLLCCLFLSLFLHGHAQPTFPCSCPALVTESINKVQRMYAGFDDRITSAGRAQYEEMKERVISLAGAAHTDRACYEAIRTYCNWFEDGHVGIWYGVNSTRKDIPKIPAAALEKASGKTNPLEGTWATSDGRQRWKILPDPERKNIYLAVVLSSADSGWTKGMVKIQFYYYDSSERMYRGMFYQDDFKGKMDGFTLTGNQLSHWFGPPLYREGSTTPVSKAAEADVQFRQISPDFCYLRLARFEDGEVAMLDSLIRTNQKAIHSTKNLIVDLRGNPGGGSGASQQMIQLIYTNPILYPAWQYKSSPEIIEETTQGIADLKKSDPYKRLAAEQRKLDSLQAHPGGLVVTGDSILRTCDSVAGFPKRVAVLADRQSGSSSEFFIFESRQSKKCTFFGTNTAGVMEYGESHGLPLACGQYSLAVAWGRNGWVQRFGLHMNNVGFAPDVRIDPAVTDWVDFVVKKWSQ